MLSGIMDWITEHTVQLATLSAAITSLVVFFGRLRKWGGDFAHMPSLVRENAEKNQEMYDQLFPVGKPSMREVIDITNLRTGRTEQIVWMRDKEDSKPIFWVNEGDEIYKVNPAFAKAFGLTEKDLANKQWMSYIDPDDFDSVIENWKTSKENNTTLDITYTHKTAGKVRAVTKPIILECGQLAGWIGEVDVIQPKGWVGESDPREIL